MFRSITSLSLMLFVALISCRSTHHLAPRVEQSLEDRETYLGGWPLAAVPCPADASVVCSTGISSQINQQCCPSGNTCFSWPSTFPVCCPTSQNCIGQLQNTPVCANSSWNMFELGQNNYFCCEQGQVGIIPLTGYAGICQAAGQAIASSLLATMVGGTSATSASSASTGTASSSTNTNSPSLGQTTATPAVTAPSSGGSSPSPSSSNNAPSSSSNSVQLGSGAIAGIAVGGAIVIAAVIFVLWRYCSRKPKGSNYAQPYQQTHATNEPVAERSLQSGRAPFHEYKTSPVYAQATRIHEVSGEHGPLGRAEMEN